MGALWSPAAPPTLRQCRQPAPKKNGILRRRKGWRCDRRRAHALFRSTPHVLFNERVRVEEFRRRLDGGGTVPQDPCMVSLGLGKKVRSSVAVLARAPPTGRQPIEERLWVPGRRRERLLRRAMGTQKYLKVWLRHRRQVLHIRRSRRQAKEDGKDRYFMPRPSEAKLAARKWHEEALRFSAEIKAASRSRSRSSQHVAGRYEVHGGRKCRRVPSPCLDTSQVTTAAGDDTTITMCHRCSRPIGSGPLAKQCECLLQRSVADRAATRSSCADLGLDVSASSN